MATEEKSRDAFDPTKRYAAVGMQLGRVLVDDDVNEGERIRLEDDRRVALDVIGPSGSPDDGLRIGNGRVINGTCDFDIGAGTFYLCGLRLWNPDKRSFALQDDWLEQTGSDRTKPQTGRIDLVYVEAWQQPVTAVEDRELFEVALGAPDTSTRLRTMFRVQLETGLASDDCPDAWKKVRAIWRKEGLGQVDEAGERIVDTTLTVTYTQGKPGNLCKPAITGGYLGAENQTIRVQLVDETHFTWGFDNAAPIYRATLDAQGTTLTLQNEPRDQAHWPVHGRIVELLPWSALLTNGEKLAAERGHLAVVDSYDATKREIVLDANTAPAGGYGTAWDQRADAGKLGPAFVYVRVWDRGDDVTSPPAIKFLPSTQIPLGSTGLSVEIGGDDRMAGDHWIIAARPPGEHWILKAQPGSPAQVVPWALEKGREVHGTRRFFAPLALIRWKAEDGFTILHDCRPHFEPLTRLRGCCTHTVGDGSDSFGRFRSIQDAIDALPKSGGKVCVLPGLYTETVRIFDRDGITIEGCGARTRWLPGEKEPCVLLVVGGRDLTVRDVGIEAGDGFGIVLLDAAKKGVQFPRGVEDVDWTKLWRGLTRVRLERIRFEIAGRSAIAAMGGTDLVIRECEILARPLVKPIVDGNDVGRWPSILSYGRQVVIEDNRILAESDDEKNEKATFTRTALGGIQLGGLSESVRIERNDIIGGNGDGVTLGSWAWAPRKVRDSFIELIAVWFWMPGLTLVTNADGCIEIGWLPPPPPVFPGQELVPVSMGPLTDITIAGNRILRMGRSGVAVARFFDLSRDDELITVDRLDIRDNHVEECLRLSIPQLPPAVRDVAAAGVIVLADVTDLQVRGNQLLRNGRTHVDPVCGVFALVTTGAIIENNRIIDNAPRRADDRETPRVGWRGGVVLYRALPPTVLVRMTGPDDGFDRDPRRDNPDNPDRRDDFVILTGDDDEPESDTRVVVLHQDGQPSARVVDNVIVVPEGRPILILGTGPMLIRDNHLVTRGVGRADFLQLLTGGEEGLAELRRGSLEVVLDFIGGVGGLVINLGLPNELDLNLGFYLMVRDLQLDEDGPGLDLPPPAVVSGNLVFAGNQVHIDLLGPPRNLALTGVLLLSLDDVLACDNEIEVDLMKDRLWFTLTSYSMTARVQGNRVKESGIRFGDKKAASTAGGLSANIGASIFSIGVLLNSTTGNQTTRCILASGKNTHDRPNQVLGQLVQPALCRRSYDLNQRVGRERFGPQDAWVPPPVTVGGPPGDAPAEMPPPNLDDPGYIDIEPAPTPIDPDERIDF